MKEIKKVQGSKASAEPIVIGKDTVYVHSNITQISDDMYEYDEVQYTMEEYVKITMEQNVSMQTELSSTQAELLNTQLAIVELYGKLV